MGYDSGEKKPNVIIIITDEHNLNTIGAYFMVTRYLQIWPTVPEKNFKSHQKDVYQHNISLKIDTAEAAFNSTSDKETTSHLSYSYL
mmetsp:Transcript_11713/g.14587  ORF Transcript_11713/g.14587 Transcript_11713/m.14587 type:complete len:87 (+) Transcript_11713:446-706(+)